MLPTLQSRRDAYFQELPPAFFPISPIHGLIHIHVPKTAGTSIRVALFGSNVIKHVKACQVATKLWEDMPSFSVVRDPVGRFISSYKYHCKSRYNGVLAKQHPNLKKMTVEEYYDTFLHSGAGLLASQSKYLTRVDTKKQIVDHILRFDKLKDDFGSLCDAYGVNVTLGRQKTTDNIEFDISKSMIIKVRDFYKDDMEILEMSDSTGL